jgi:hypothetical protein
LAPALVLEVPGQPLDRLYDAVIVGGSSKYLQAQRPVMHEFDPLVGLAQPSEPAAIMAPHASAQAADYGAEDWAGVVALGPACQHYFRSHGARR